MKHLFGAVYAIFYLISILPAGAQDFKSAHWSAYGVKFQVPADISIEDDSEEGYVLSNEHYYISVQILDGEPVQKEMLKNELQHVANDDQLTQQTPILSFNLPHFYGVQLSGLSQEEYSLYAYLMAKDESCGFFVSIIYPQKEDQTPTTILKSFQLED